jgi:hypothetical protein
MVVGIPPCTSRTTSAMWDICPICHELLQDGNTSALSPCNHVFHNQCIMEAMRARRHGPGVCPVCRDPGEHGAAETESSDVELLAFPQVQEASLNISELGEVDSIMFVCRSAFEDLRTLFQKPPSTLAWLCVVRQLVLWPEAADVHAASLFSDHMKLLPVSEPLVAICMKQVLEMFQGHGYTFPHSGWRATVRAELGSNIGDDSLAQQVGFTLFADAFVKGAVRASVISKQKHYYRKPCSQLVIGDLESGMYGEDGKKTLAGLSTRWIHKAEHNRLKTKLARGEKVKAEVVHLLIKKCLYQRDRHHSVPLKVNDDFDNMIRRCFDAYEWDPVGEVRAAVKSEKEFGTPSANSIAKRIAAAKAQAKAAEKSDFIGNPEWKLSAYRCMEIIYEAEGEARNALYQLLGTQRSLDLITAWGCNEVTQLPHIPPRSIPLAQQKIITRGAKSKKCGNVHSVIQLLKMKAKPPAVIKTKAATRSRKKPKPCSHLTQECYDAD